MDTEIIYQHGWAFDSSSWSSWITGFRPDATVIAGDRGYFGVRKVRPLFSNSATERIIIAHSFGAHLLEPKALASCNQLVLINSFIGLADNARAIRAMLKKFPTTPDHVVNDFWRNSYLPECDGMSLLPPPGMNEVRLEEDLELLLESELRVDLIRAIPNVVLLQSDEDGIVPTAAHDALHRALPHASVVELAGAGHAAHLTQVDKCIQLVSYLLPRTQSNTLCSIQK